MLMLMSLSLLLLLLLLMMMMMTIASQLLAIRCGTQRVQTSVYSVLVFVSAVLGDFVFMYAGGHVSLRVETP